MHTVMTIIHADGREETRTVDLPAQPSYEALRDLIKPVFDADFEHVTILGNDERADMFVDETGRLKSLTRNDKATELYRAAWLKRHPGINPESLDHIVGAVVLFDRRVWF